MCVDYFYLEVTIIEKKFRFAPNNCPLYSSISFEFKFELYYTVSSILGKYAYVFCVLDKFEVNRIIRIQYNY
jgi:hypothetical protein